MSKKKFLIILSMMILLISAVTIASDLIIESKTQTYSEQDSLIKFLGDVKVRYKDITIVFSAGGNPEK
jgi:lipopolysaccharide assembly outer membrane protein LptD (OstA)